MKVDDPYKTSWSDNSKRPIDKLGDSIADKFKGKF